MAHPLTLLNLGQEGKLYRGQGRSLILHMHGVLRCRMEEDCLWGLLKSWVLLRC